METQTFPSALGDIWLSGEPDAFNSQKPIVLAISGAFAEPDAFDQLAMRLPDAAVLVGRLPGNHCPALVSNSIGAFAAAYDAAIRDLGRPTIVCGASIGGVVALALREPLVRGLVLLEPVLRTSGLWPLIPRLQAVQAAGAEPHVAEFIWNVFGVSASGLEDRDYRGLLESLKKPAWCVLGEVPLQPPRLLERDPSYVDAAERELLAAHPLVRIVTAPGVGHNVPGEAGPVVLPCIRRLLGAAVPQSG